MVTGWGLSFFIEGVSWIGLKFFLTEGGLGMKVAVEHMGFQMSFFSAIYKGGYIIELSERMRYYSDLSLRGAISFRAF